MFKKILAAIALGVLPPVAALADSWSVRLDTSIIPYAAAYQSFTDLRQAVGFEKRVVSVTYEQAEVVKLGVFGGATSKAVGRGPQVVAGPTLAVPGSLLDWALGTTWGQQWLPKLRTGVMISYDLVRPSQAHFKPDFYGFGIAYPVGG